METRLKALLRERHWTYSAFCREYDRTAGAVAPELAGTAPSRAQLHRWISGQLKGLPFPDHCRMLERMFPGWTVAQLFEPVDVTDQAEGPSIDRLVQRLSASSAGWGAYGSRRVPPDSPVAPDGVAALVAKRLLAVARLRRMDAGEAAQIAGLAGNVIELNLMVDIDIDDAGAVTLRAQHELFNLSDTPLTRLSRELWFQSSAGALTIGPAPENSRRISIQRIHGTAEMAKFACRVSPAIQPGEVATVGYTCSGGIFDEAYYWRQDIRNFTRHLTMTVRHREVASFLGCEAVEEHPDGGENSASEDLLWDHEDGVATIAFTRDYLRPGQSLTLRWDFAR